MRMSSMLRWPSLFVFGLALSFAPGVSAQEATEAPDAAPPAPLESADPAADDSGDDGASEAPASADPAESDAAATDEGDELYNSPDPAPRARDDEDPLYNDADRYNPDEGKPAPAAEGQAGEGGQPEGAGADAAADEPAGSDAVRDTRPEDPYTPQGLETAVVYPIQFCSGCLSISVLSVLLAPLAAIPVFGQILVPLIAWGATSAVMTTAGDGLGKNRGQIAWPWVAGMCVDMGCGGVSMLILSTMMAGVSTVSGLGITVLLQVIDPSRLPTDSQSLQTYLIAAGAALGLVAVVFGTVGFVLMSGTRCASVNAAALTYTVASDTKQDDEFRMPGFFTANHGEERSNEPRVRSPEETDEAAPADEADEAGEAGDAYEDEGVDEGSGDTYDDGGDYAWFYGEVGVPAQVGGSISF